MKIIFFDIDGTLIDEKKYQMLPSTIKAIETARKNGHICMVNTGRTDKLVGDRLSKFVEFDGYLMGCGTMITYHNQVLFHKTFSEEDARYIIEGLKKYKIDAVLEGSENNYHDALDRMHTKVFHDYMLRFKELHYGSYEEAVGRFDKFYCFVEEKDTMDAFRAEYGDLLDFIDRERGFYEVVPKGYSKASAMNYIAEHLGISMENTVAIGDSSNDIAMLKAAHTAIAMGNATKIVLDLADYVTTHVEQNGIWNALKWLGVLESEIVTIAQLDSKYPKTDYLKIKDENGRIYYGGNQNWWSKKVEYPEAKGRLEHLQKIKKDKYYRMWKTGCGIIAMCDVELHINAKKTESDLCFDENMGAFHKDDYMMYIEAMYEKTYKIRGSLINTFFTGLKPWVMKKGFRSFLNISGYGEADITWAKHFLHSKKRQKDLVLRDVEEMLKNNIPVVFAYYSLSGKKVVLYPNVNSLIENQKGMPATNAHYMTIIGLLRCHNKKILKIVSWGNIYYIDYDEYAEKLSCFSNILTVDGFKRKALNFANK